MFKFRHSQNHIVTDSNEGGVSSRGWWRPFRAFCLLSAYHSGRSVRFTLRWCWRLLLTAYFLFALLFLVARFFILPSVERYKPEIEQYVSQQLQREVKIDNLRAYWQGWHPELQLDGFQVFDQQHQPAFHVQHVRAQVSWWTVFVFDLRFSKFDIMRPELSARRATDGHIEVAGFPLGAHGKGKGTEQALEWILSQGEISVSDGRFAWADQTRPDADLILEKLNLVLRNEWRHHKIAIQATPPANLASPIDLRADLKQAVFAKRRSDLNTWSGELFADLKDADLPKLHHYLDLPLKLEKSVGALRAWLRVDSGHIADLTMDLHLRDVLGRFRHDLPPLDMARISGRVIVAERVIKDYSYLPNIFGQTGHSLAVENLTMQTRDGLVLPATSVRETYIPAQKQQAERVELFAKSLDLKSIANFAEHLPLPADQRRLLIDVAPKGLLKSFTARWQGSFPEIASYMIEGEFSGLEMRPLKAQLARPKIGKQAARAGIPAIPGFDNLSGSISANEKGGRLLIDSQAVRVQLPTYFVDPEMPFDRLEMQAKWEIKANQELRFEIQKFDFEQNGARAHAYGTHQRSLHETDLGELDLRGELDGFDLRTITRYVPEKTPEHLRHWLSNALLEGQANKVSLRLRGRLQDFPFTALDAKGQSVGEFQVKGLIVNGKLNFLPGVFAKDGLSPFWPVIDNIKGSFLFDKARMEIRAETAQTNQANLNKVSAIIPDLGSHQALLQIDGNANAGLQTMFNYVKASPVDDWLGGFLHESVGSGNAQLNLKLDLPLQAISEARVNGVLQLNGSETVLQPGIPLISNAIGKLEFNERGLTLNNIKSQVLGGPMVASGGTQKDGTIRMRFEGLATSEGIQNHLKDTELAALLEKLSGNARYATQVNVKRRQVEIVVDSNLQGLGMDLPEPFRKMPVDFLPLHFELQPESSADLSELRDSLKLSLGDRLNAQYQRRKKLDKGARTQVVRGSIGVFTAPTVPQDGVALQANLKTLNVDDWLRLLEHLPTTQTKMPVDQSPSVSKQAVDSEIMQYVLPQKVSLITEELQIFGKKLENIVFGASRNGVNWQSNLDARQISGSVNWIPPNEKHAHGLISAHLSRLLIPKSAANEVGDLLQLKSSTQSLPALEIQSDQLELYGKSLGQLDLAAKNVSSDLGQQWVIEHLKLKNEDAELKANGYWRVRNQVNQSTLNFALDVMNSGRLLDRFGFKDLLRGGKGKIDGEVSWQGVPFEFDIPSLSGQLQLKLGAGQFLKMDPAGSKLIGVLNMQSIPRRFTLDFRDVFSEGFAFDTIAGTALIEKGVAHTENLKMNSVSATVLMEGKADIAHETQDLHVAMIPDMNVGAASVVYGLAVNPVIGLGSFLAQLLFKDPLKRAFTYEYQITGSWTDPVVTKIENAERQAILEKQKADKLKAEKAKAEATAPQKGNR